MSVAEVSAIIPVWNRKDLLSRLLKKLHAQTHPLTEILVIDNGSADGSAEMAEREGARVIRMGCNAGFSRAVNRGIQESSTGWLAIVNNDLEPDPDWLEQLMNAALQPDVWFATGKLLNAAQRDRIDGVYDALCRGACPWRIGNNRKDDLEFCHGRAIRMASATACLYRAELFRSVGLLDERFESYLEDVDFGLRCALLGHSGRYVPEAVAYHAASATLGRWHSDSVRRAARNQVLLVAKHYPTPLLLRYGWAILVAQGLWGLVALRHGRGWAFLRGKLAGLRLFRALRREARCDWVRLATILAEDEQEIRNVQRRTGFDLYWRLYFFLTAGGAN